MGYYLTRCTKCDELHEAVPATAESAGFEYWLQVILGFCREHGIEPDLAGTVSEKQAALILNRSPYTLRNRRKENGPIPASTDGGRVRYAVLDIARYLDVTRPAEPY